MLERLVIFGIGYMLGAKAGRERFDELVDMAKGVLARDDVKTVVSLAGGFLDERLSRSPEELRVA